MFVSAAEPTSFNAVFSSVNTQSPRGFSGVAIIAKGTEVIFSHQADSVNGSKFTNDTQFIIGSLSKQITAALVLREVDQGRVDLDAPIDKPLKTEPGVSFAYSNLGFNLLGQLVAVTSGQSYSTLATMKSRLVS
jgi:D-alanyl-D-alanine carboxypeptidase